MVVTTVPKFGTEPSRCLVHVDFVVPVVQNILFYVTSVGCHVMFEESGREQMMLRCFVKFGFYFPVF